MQSRPPPEHVPRPPIGAAPLDTGDGGDDEDLVIEPDDEGEVGEAIEAEPEADEESE